MYFGSPFNALNDSLQGFAEGLGKALGLFYWGILLIYSSFPWLYAVWRNPKPSIYWSGLVYWVTLYFISNHVIGDIWLVIPVTVGALMYVVKNIPKKKDDNNYMNYTVINKKEIE